VIDIIGDVHGQFDKLVALLLHLGYRDTAGTWRHPNRSAIFVGDLIDRGPKQFATVDLVRRMVDAGSARCIMGNHEFNAIAWATDDPMQPGKFLRPHGKPGNLDQHRAFLAEVEGTPRHAEIIAWFRTLPLWLDLGDLRQDVATEAGRPPAVRGASRARAPLRTSVSPAPDECRDGTNSPARRRIRIVHACWHQPSIDLLQRKMGAANCLTDEMVQFGNRRGHSVFEAIETICKGPEVNLPPGVFFKDASGKVRNEVRVRWWEDDLSTYRKAAIGPPEEMQKIPDVPMPAAWLKEFRRLPQEVATREAREASRVRAPATRVCLAVSSEHRDVRTARPDEEQPPVVFGHYWFAGRPEVISPRFACVDYSAAKDGALVAYRWDGETELKSEKLAWVGAGSDAAMRGSVLSHQEGLS
jgi:hypothetical protein